MGTRFGAFGPTVRRSSRDQGVAIAGMTVHHGTLGMFESSVRGGPQNVGKGFGGRGLYVAVDGERSVAAFFAKWAEEEAPARRAHNTSVAGAGSEEGLVLTGTVTANRDLRVGVFTIRRDGPPDLARGILPANWDNDPTLRAALEKHFDVLDLRDMQKSGLAIETNRFLVFHQGAGADAIVWRPGSEKP
jgi:hypothetical protein